jgi:drug/metabolite transporter (DMT)-like permease
MARNLRSSPTAALIALVLVTAIWGSTFLVVKNAIVFAPVLDFLAIRFIVAALVMFAIRHSCLRGMTRQGLLRGFLLGLALGAGYVLQTFGLLTASATVSGFITGMFVVFTPLVSWALLHQRAGWNTWLAVALAVAGLALLALHGWSAGIGELLTLGCALFFALHIVGLGAWAPRHQAYGLAFIQIVTVGSASLLVALPHGIDAPLRIEVWGAIAITAVLATAAAFLIQTWAQSIVPPTPAAVVMTMEPVFAGIFGVAFGGDAFTLRIIAGAVCVLTAMFLVQMSQAPARMVRPRGARPASQS